MTLSLTILLTGFAVVFAVLLVLIGIIKLYSTIIYNLQNKKRNQKKKEPITVERDPAPAVEIQPAAAIDSAEDEDDALIAVISAAVYAVYSPAQVRVRSIRRSSSGTNAWRSAGLADSTRPF